MFFIPDMPTIWNLPNCKLILVKCKSQMPLVESRKNIKRIANSLNESDFLESLSVKNGQIIAYKYIYYHLKPK